VVNLQSRLDGGTYELVCGTLTSPRGTLTVSGGAAATRAPSSVVDQATIDAAVAEYRTYVLGQSADLITVIGTFTKAVDDGDLEAAKAAYGPSRVPWERVEPIAELFADLDPKIDAREDDYQAGVDDPGFTGYHKLEQLLYAVGTTDGTAELTAGLRANVAELRTKLETLEIDPRVMTQGAGVLIDEVAQSKMTGEEDRYSKLDLWSIDPNLEGSAKIVDILRPTLTTIDKDYLQSLDDAYASVTTIIDKYGSQSTGFKTFDQISAGDLKAMQAGLANLSELLSELSGRLGLEA
jgi:iron uptake system component EfeO